MMMKTVCFFPVSFFRVDFSAYFVRWYTHSGEIFKLVTAIVLV